MRERGLVRPLATSRTVYPDAATTFAAGRSPPGHWAKARCRKKAAQNALYFLEEAFINPIMSILLRDFLWLSGLEQTQYGIRLSEAPVVDPPAAAPKLAVIGHKVWAENSESGRLRKIWDLVPF
jgi:hypothetical protein